MSIVPDLTPIPNGYKRCSTCHLIKPYSAFRRIKRNRDGFDTRCKYCWKARYVPHPKKTAVELFWTHVDKNCANGCWEWAASKSKDGYGKATLNGKSIRAHRLSWRIVFGDIPPSLQVLHRCDNPLCVNPGHLFLGTTQDNTRDKVEKGRCQPQQGELNPCHKLTEEDVITIRIFYSAGYSQHELARMWNTDQANISCIVRRKTWRHVNANFIS